MMKKPSINFPRESIFELNFLASLNQKIDAYFVENSFSQKASIAMWGRAVFFLMGYLGSWYYLVFRAKDPFFALLFCMLFGFFGTGIALNIGHESCHNTYSKYSWVNKLLYWLSMNCLGTYHYLWRLGHLATHHQYTNIPGMEVGIEGKTVLRFGPHTSWRWFHRYQWLYAVPLYSIYTLTWVFFRDWRVLFACEMPGLSFKWSWYRFFELLIIKFIYFYVMLFIPLRYSSFTPTQVVLGFLILHATFSIYLASLLFISHLSDKVVMHEIPEGPMKMAKTRHHLESTLDINPESFLASFCLGGFNTHVIHHLYPQISSIHYQKLTVLLRETCMAHKMPYHATNLLEGIRSHFRFLKLMGSNERTPSSFT